MIKKFSGLIIILMVSICTGCGNGNIASADGVKKCSRTGTIDGATSNMNYELYYEGEYLTILHSTETVVSGEQEILDTYEEAYKKIFAAYDGLEYYEAKIIRDKTSVTSDITINYTKIDTDALLAIEGEEDNVIDKDGKVKLEAWLDFAEPFGVECE